MKIDLQSTSRILIQGLDPTLTIAAIQTMQTYGTNIIGIVSAGKGGQQVGEIPIFDLVEQAQAAVGEIDTSLIFVPPYAVLDAALEAIACGIRQLIIVTRSVPPLDMIRLFRRATLTDTFMIGSGSAGIIIPDRLLWGVYNPQLFSPGKVAIVSRNHSLTSEIATSLNQADLGQSIVVHLGSDRLVGSSCRWWLEYLQTDPLTEAIVLVGDISWDSEAVTTEYLQSSGKPVVAYLPGSHSNTSQSLKNPALVVTQTLSKPLYDTDIIQQRIKAYRQAKIPLAKKISQIPALVQKALTEVVSTSPTLQN
jgi:succinyl-CoA synthetase alpha subunit